jgi:hypothetical protein
MTATLGDRALEKLIDLAARFVLMAATSEPTTLLAHGSGVEAAS